MAVVLTVAVSPAALPTAPTSPIFEGQAVTVVIVAQDAETQEHIDASALRLWVRSPQSVLPIIYDAAQMSADGTGRWRFDLALDTPGRWRLRAECDGPRPASREILVNVAGSGVVSTTPQGALLVSPDGEVLVTPDARALTALRIDRAPAPSSDELGGMVLFGAADGQLRSVSYNDLRADIQATAAGAGEAAAAGLLVGRVFATRADALAGTLPSVVMEIRTLGYYERGDGGGARYVRVTARPFHRGFIELADGSLWNLNEQVADVRMFGARGIDGIGGVTSSFNDGPAIQDAFNWSAATDRKVLIQAPVGGRFVVDEPLYLPPSAAFEGSDVHARDYLPGLSPQSPRGANFPGSVIRANFGPPMHNRATLYVGPRAFGSGVTVQGYTGSDSGTRNFAFSTREFSGLRFKVTAPTSTFTLPYPMPAPSENTSAEFRLRVFVGGSELGAAGFSLSGTPVRGWYPAGTVITLAVPASSTTVSMSPGAGGRKAYLWDCSGVFGYDNFELVDCIGFVGVNLTGQFAGRDNFFMGEGCTDAEVSVASAGAGRDAVNMTAATKVTLRGTAEQSGRHNLCLYDVHGIIVDDLQIDVSGAQAVSLGLVGDSKLKWAVRRSCYNTVSYPDAKEHLLFTAPCWDNEMEGSYQQGVKPDDRSQRVSYTPAVETALFSIPFAFPATPGGLVVTVNGRPTTAFSIVGTASGGIYPALSQVQLGNAISGAVVVAYLGAELRPDFIYRVPPNFTLTNVVEVGVVSPQAKGVFADEHTRAQIRVANDNASTHPGYRSNAWYGMPVTSFATGTVAGGPGGAANSVMYAHPIQIEDDVTIDRLGLVIGVSVPGVTGKLALYSHDRAISLPGKLLAPCTGTVSMGAVAGSPVTAPLSVVVRAVRGPYWVVSMFDGNAQPSCFNPASTGASLLAHLLGGASLVNLLTASASTGITKVVSPPVDFAAGFPDVFPSPAPTANVPGAPYIGWRAA